MTTKKQKRRSLVIAQLAEMSKDWSKWTPADWCPLEAELRDLNEAVQRERDDAYYKGFERKKWRNLKVAP